MGQFMWVFPVLIIFLQHHFAYSSLSLSSPTENINRQKLALFQFKLSLGINISDSVSGYCFDSHPKTMNWSMSSDHCTWDGVTCHEITGDVIGIDLSCSQLVGTILPNSSLFQLSHLQTLDLSGNDFSLSHQIPRELGGFAPNLMHLDLSESGFSGKIPSEIAHLHKLVSLHISSPSHVLSLEHEVFKFLLQNSTQLRELYLYRVDISSILPTNLSSSLRRLLLGFTGLHGELPEEVFHLPNLESLSLSGNTNLGIKFPKVKWGSSSTLTKLLLGLTNISGEIPDAIGHLRSIMILDLGFTGLHGELPEEVFHLPNLESLSLDGNTNLGIKFPKVKWGSSSTLTELFLGFTNISGEIPDAIGHLRSIMILDLPGCNLSGPIPNVFANLKNLSILSLADNNLNGPFPSWIVGLRELIGLHLGNNSLSGPLPSNLIGSGLQKLWFLNLSNNLLNGTMPSWLFALPSLAYLDLDSNTVTGQLDEYQYSTSLTDISCKNNTLFGFIPKSFLQLVNLAYLDFSSNNITGVLEIDMLSRLNNLDSLDLSNNQIHGQIPRLLGSTWGHSLRYVDLSHNLLTGGIEQFRMKNLIYLNLRSNMLNGSLSWSICNSSSLEILNLSHNNLSGVLPRCPGYLNYSLSVLDLQMNNFRGTIPSTLSNFRYLRNLNLHGNHLEGTIPRSFANFKYLEILNLGSNYMNGTFPNWLETLPNLQVLVMRSNRFNGPIRNNPKTKHPFPSLRIIDLSHNEFSGLLPEPYFKNFQAMMNFDVNRMELKYMGSDRYGYRDSVTIIIKGLEVEYVRILTVFTTIDLSSNNFEGRIPQCIGTLNSLLFLNLSHNGLGGHMPSQLGNLSMLESLDISFNQLEGEIPQQLTRLGFLASLNLSQNHLSGPIPRGKQFNTFENNSYGGNSALCGSPLSKECEKDETRAEFEEEGDSEFVSSGFTWEAVLMGYGCGIVLGFIIGYLMFLLGKPKWFTGIVDRELPHWIKVRRQEIRY